MFTTIGDLPVDLRAGVRRRFWWYGVATIGVAAAIAITANGTETSATRGIAAPNSADATTNRIDTSTTRATAAPNRADPTTNRAETSTTRADPTTNRIETSTTPSSAAPNSAAPDSADPTTTATNRIDTSTTRGIAAPNRVDPTTTASRIDAPAHIDPTIGANRIAAPIRPERSTQRDDLRDERCDAPTCALHGNERECCAPFRATPLPEALDRAMVEAAIASVKPAIVACAAGTTSQGTIRIAIDVGGNGRVAHAAVDEAPEASVARCIAAVLRTARFTATQHGGTFAYRYDLP